MKQNKKTLLKVKASSLVETLIATVIIMVVFGIAMASISSILKNTVNSSTNKIDSQLNKFVYQYEHGLIIVPDIIEVDRWNVEVKKQKEGVSSFIVFKAVNRDSKKVRTKKVIEN